MTDNNADETAADSKLSRRTAMVLMGTSAAGGSAATSAFSQLTADRPIDVSVNSNDLDASFDGTNNQLTLTNNSGSSIDATLVLNDNLTLVDNLATQTLNGASLDKTNDNQPVVTGISSGSSVTLTFGRFLSSSTVDFETQWDNGADGFDVSTTKSGSVDRIQRLITVGGAGTNNDLTQEAHPTDGTTTRDGTLEYGTKASMGDTIDGTVYTLGGYNTGRRVQSYDTVTDTTDVITDGNGTELTIPYGRSQGVATEINGLIYQTMGRDESNNTYGEVIEFDPSGPSITDVTDSNGNTVTMPNSVRLVNGSNLNGKLYVMGGYDGSNSDYIQYFDPSGPTATQPTDSNGNIISMPISTRSGAVAGVNGSVYHFAGNSSERIYEYDISAETCTKVTDGNGNDLLGPRGNGWKATDYNGKIYIVGGDGTKLYEFDPSVPSIAEATDANGNIISLPNDTENTVLALL